MRDNIIDLKCDEIKEVLEKNEFECGLIVNMFALERLWQPFVFSTSKRTWDVQSKVRKCMDMIWERILDSNISKKRESEFENLLENITQRYLEDDDMGIEYSYCFDSCLMSALYSDIGYYFGRASKYNVSINGIAATLDLLGDYVADTEDSEYKKEFEDIIKDSKLVLSKIERIDSDIQFVLGNYKNMKNINERKEIYKDIKILPLDDLELDS